MGNQQRIVKARAWLRANRGLVVFLLCFGFFRTAVADWNPIPSSSMRPTLLEGDVVLVNRLAFDLKVPLTDIAVARLGEPLRGDVVTFHSPRDGVRLIKRVVGLPGDVVELRDEQLYVNGQPVAVTNRADVQEPLRGDVVPAVRAIENADGREHPVQYLPMIQAMRSFGPVTVPANHYFMMGDNRDNSSDSRYIGFVPRQLLIGRAHHVLVSADINGHWAPRFERVGEAIP
jgi:signal peptidase I